MSFLKKAQQHVAHTSKLPALGNQDLKQLQHVITSEKNFIQSNTKAANDFKKNAEAIKAWSAEEGPDLNDVVGKVSLLYDHYSAAQNRLNSHLSTVRLHFKSIRTREESLADLKARKRSLGSDIEKVERKLAKMGPENKELMKVTSQLKEMRGEMERLHIEVMNEEAAIGDFKRRTLREALGIKSGALLELAEKLTIVAEISKLMLQEIPLQPTQPGMPRAEYFGFAKTESLLQEATRCIADVGFTPTGPSAGIPRFGDTTLADTTTNESRDLSHSYANPDAADPYPDFPTRGSAADGNADAGYDPSVDRVLSNEHVARTPIYAAHSSRSEWAREAAVDQPTRSDSATNEWAQSSYERGDTSTASAAAAAALAATAGSDLNAVPGHGDPSQPDGGFLMQNSRSFTGSAGLGGGAQQYGSNRNSADYQSAQGGHGAESALAGLGPRATAAPSNESHHSDAYGGYTTTPAQPETTAPPTLGAPTLPPLRSATPLSGPTHSTQAPVRVASPAPNTATDDSAYFQSIGSTRAMQEAVRRPTSPPDANAGRMASYGALGAAPPAGAIGGEGGKKVTAAAFRRGFSRNPSAQNSMSTIAPANAPHDEQAWGANPLPQPPSLQSHANLTTPTPPGGYNGNTPDSEHSSVPPLHIQKRNSNSYMGNNMLGAAAAAGTPPAMQGRRYSNEIDPNELNVSGSDNPAPPYLPGQQTNGVNTVDYAHHPHPGVNRQNSSQYAEYAAPPPPGYGYA